MSPVLRLTLRTVAFVCAAVLGAAGCSETGDATGGTGPRESGAPGAEGGPRGGPGGAGPEADAERAEAAALPGLGPLTRAQVPAASRQVLVVTGAFVDSFNAEAVLYRWGPDGWEAGPVWEAYNALRGWTEVHHRGDLRTPVGVFTLSDAGGLLPDPGSLLPYHRSPAFRIDGVGFHGEALAGSFDHVIAIDYNRLPGTSPLDRTRPLGPERGGGIWLHVDHEGPTQGCVSLPAEAMRELLRTLDPARHPVIVMGDAESLAR